MNISSSTNIWKKRLIIIKNATSHLGRKKSSFCCEAIKNKR